MLASSLPHHFAKVIINIVTLPSYESKCKTINQRTSMGYAKGHNVNNLALQNITCLDHVDNSKT